MVTEGAGGRHPDQSRHPAGAHRPRDDSTLVLTDDYASTRHADSRHAAATGSSRTQARPTAPTWTAPRSPRRCAFRSARPCMSGKTVIELRPLPCDTPRACNAAWSAPTTGLRLRGTGCWRWPTAWADAARETQLVIAALAHLDDDEPGGDILGARTRCPGRNSAIADRLKLNPELDGWGRRSPRSCSPVTGWGLVHRGLPRLPCATGNSRRSPDDTFVQTLVDGTHHPPRRRTAILSGR